VGHALSTEDAVIRKRELNTENPQPGRSRVGEASDNVKLREA